MLLDRLVGSSPTISWRSIPIQPNWKFHTRSTTAALFATSETIDKGRFISVGFSYSVLDGQIIANRNMPFVQVYAGTEGDVIAILEAAVAAKEPTIMFWWTPTAAVGR